MSITAVYRMFDRAGDLLYVGVSLAVMTRFVQHSDKPWADEIANMTIERFPTRQAALDAEAVAITMEDPRYNVRRPRRGPSSERTKDFTALFVRVAPEQHAALTAHAHRRGEAVAVCIRAMIDEAEE